MLGLDKLGVDRLLLQLEERSFIDPRYRFVKENNELKLLGTGGYSYVYEMYDSLAPSNHYAAKVLGLGTKTVDAQLVRETTQIQYFLGEQSENIMRVIALCLMKLHLDENGNIIDITDFDQEGYEEAEGVPVQIILIEKLDSILEKDKFGNLELSRDELKTEEGVIRFAKDIGSALFAVHSNGYLHRDIKLENIFWDPLFERYKLGDFGFARFVGNGGAETIIHTNGYGAPEIERHLSESYNVTADIYSLGITLFLMLNELKFPASDGYHVNFAQYEKDFIIPAPSNSSVEMAKIIRKMCSFWAVDRYQSMEEILMDIGRIDGSYSDDGFAEYPDVETNTYHGEDENPVGSDSSSDDEGDSGDAEKGKIPWYKKKDSELNREDRKKRAQEEDSEYAHDSVWTVIFTTLLTLFLFESLMPNASCVSRWEFWIVPVAVFVEAILQRVKEFHVEFGFVTVGIAVFSIYYLGPDIPQVAAVIVVLMGMPAITAGVSLGMGMWIAQILSGKFAWLGIFSKLDLGWFVLFLLAVVIQKHIFKRWCYEKSGKNEMEIADWIMDKIWYLMIIAGVLLLILGYFKVIAVPETVMRLHPERVGIALFIAERFHSWHSGLHEKADDIDESLDE